MSNAIFSNADCVEIRKKIKSNALKGKIRRSCELCLKTSDKEEKHDF